MFPFVILGDVKAASRLLGFEGIDDFFRFGDPPIVGMQSGEICKGGDCLRGDALVVFRALGLFGISQPLMLMIRKIVRLQLAAQHSYEEL